MRIVIVGIGRVGTRTARVLKSEGHEVTLVENDPDKVEKARNQGYEVVEGDGASEAVLLETDLDGADAVGALTGDLNVNFVACMVAKAHGCRTVLRIDEDYREEIYRKYADEIDEIVYPERLGAIGAKNALLGGDVTAIADLADNLQVVQFRVREESPMQGYGLSELELPARSNLLAFGKRDGPLLLPAPDETLEVGDRIAVLVDFEVLDDVRQILVGDPARAADVGGVADGGPGPRSGGD